MNAEELKNVLNNPAASPEQRAAALDHIGEAANKATDLEGELLRSSRKPNLASIEDYSIGEFCRSCNWTPEARSLFDKWLFKSPTGIEGVTRMGEALRRSDWEEYGAALADWKDSGYKRGERLIRALEAIVQSPDKGNYHDEKAVEKAREFLAELKHRAGAAHA